MQASFGIAQGSGPAYATINTENVASPAIFHFADSQHFGADPRNNQSWGGGKVLWFINPVYQGFILVRGRQLDGPHEIRFDGGPERQPLTSRFMIDTTEGGTPWPNFPSHTRLQAPGCYAYQVDGRGFSDVIVFRAVVQN